MGCAALLKRTWDFVEDSGMNITQWYTLIMNKAKHLQRKSTGSKLRNVPVCAHYM